MIYLLLFASSFMQVFARAMQQLNVVNYKWIRIPVVSYMMAATQYIIIAFISVQTYETLDAWNGLPWWPIPWEVQRVVYIIGTGGWMGSFVAMYLHKLLEK